MLIDGEKYACDACVKGHRVSNCQHRDRKLQHINKKGRPVSQCTHCRTLRKSRSAHVKCDCGEKGRAKGQCSHNGKGESNPGPGGELSDYHGTESDSDISAVGNQPCCCTHGARCSCAVKKEDLEPVQELILTNESTTRDRSGKPRLSSVQSDGSLAVFSNGHHKPIHKYNNMAHKCGAPYQIPRPHTIHGPSHFAPRSVDSLPLSKIERPSSSTDEPVFSAPKTDFFSRSEHGSPLPQSNPTFSKRHGCLPPLEISYPAYSNGALFSPEGDLSAISSASLDKYTTTPDADQSLFPNGLAKSPDNWPSYPWSFDESHLMSTSCISLSHSNISQPHTSSGDLSDVDDLTSFSHPSPLDPPHLGHNRLSSDISELQGPDAYRLSSDVHSGLTQTSNPTQESFAHGDVVGFFSGSTKPDNASVPEAVLRADNSLSAVDEYLLNQQSGLPRTSLSTEYLDSDLPVTHCNLDPLWVAGFNNDIPNDLWSG